MTWLGIPIVALVFTGFWFAEGWQAIALVALGWTLLSIILGSVIGRSLREIGDESELHR